MALIGVGRLDDGVPVKRRTRMSDDGARKVINVEAVLVDEVNEYAEKLEEKFGFKPTFSQALRYVLKELRSK